MTESNYNMIQSTEIKQIKTEPGIELADKTVQNGASASIRVKCLSSLQADSSVNEKTVKIKQEPVDDILKEIEELEALKNIEQSNGNDTDDFIGSKDDPCRAIVKAEKTENIPTKKKDRKKHRKSKKRRSSHSLSSSDSQSDHNSKKKLKRSSSKELEFRESEKLKSRKRSTADRSDKYETKRSEKRHRSRDQHSQSPLRSNDSGDFQKRKTNIENYEELVLDNNHSKTQRIENLADSEVSEQPQPQPQQITSNGTSDHRNTENITTLHNLRPIIVKTELAVVPEKSNEIQVKQELVSERPDDIDNDEDVDPPLPIVTSIKEERGSGILSKNQIKLEGLQGVGDISKKALENCAIALENFTNFKNDSYAGQFFYTASKLIQPSFNKPKHVSPLLESKPVYFSYSTSDVQYSNFGIISLPPLMTKIANLIGYDISNLIDKLSEFKKDNENLLKSKEKLIPAPDNEDVYLNIIQSTSTQTDMIPCIECAVKNLQNSPGDELKEHKSTCVGTDPEIPLITNLRTANADQLLALNDFFELLLIPQSNEPIDRFRLRDRLVEIFDKGQKPLTNSGLMTLQQPTHGIIPNCVMQPNNFTQILQPPNNFTQILQPPNNFTQILQPPNSMQYGYQMPQNQQPYIPIYLNSMQNPAISSVPQQPAQEHMERPTKTPLVPPRTPTMNKNDPRTKQNDQNDLVRSSTLKDLYGDENSKRASTTKPRGRGRGRGKR